MRDTAWGHAVWAKIRWNDEKGKWDEAARCKSKLNDERGKRDDTTRENNKWNGERCTPDTHAAWDKGKWYDEKSPWHWPHYEK